MVDKVDRPEAPAPWRIKEPGRTKDDRHSREQEESKEQKKEKFEKRAEGKWDKFDSRTMIIKPVRVPLRDIKTVRFRNAFMHSGVATLQGDLVWTNGRVTEGSMFRLASFDEYFKAKKLRPGDEVPREMWAKSDPLEVGIPQEKTPSGSFAVEELEREAAERKAQAPKPKAKKVSWLTRIGLRSKQTNEFQWAILVLYLIVAAGLGLAIHAILTMTRV